MKKRPTLLIMGPQGSGKGTQTELIEEQFGYHVVEAGAILRRIKEEDSELGHKVKEIIDSGGHLTDQDITDILDDHIKNIPNEEPLLIDGYPRSMGQAEQLTGLLEKSGRDPQDFVVIWLDISRPVAEKRLSSRGQCETCKAIFMDRSQSTCPHCGGNIIQRKDDTPEAIKKRLDWFDELILPTIKYYEEQGKVIKINGEQEVVHVFDDIRKSIDNYGNN